MFYGLGLLFRHYFLEKYALKRRSEKFSLLPPLYGFRTYFNLRRRQLAQQR